MTEFTAYLLKRSDGKLVTAAFGELYKEPFTYSNGDKDTRAFDLRFYRTIKNANKAISKVFKPWRKDENYTYEVVQVKVRIDEIQEPTT